MNLASNLVATASGRAGSITRNTCANSPGVLIPYGNAVTLVRPSRFASCNACQA